MLKKIKLLGFIFFVLFTSVFFVLFVSCELETNGKFTGEIAGYNGGGKASTTYNAATSSEFLEIVATIKNDENGGNHIITVKGNFAVTGITFKNFYSYTANNKKITIKGDDINRMISNSGSSILFNVERNITLEIGNNITLNGNSNSASLVRIESYGTFKMDSGSTISDANDSGVDVFGGTFNMAGGTISGNTGQYGGGVCVSSSGTFNMAGGTISGNTGQHGGGVYFSSSGTFNMAGGTISGNTASSYGGYAYGGGVCVNSGTFSMTGGTISGNTASYGDSYAYGGGVFVNSGTFTKTGGGTIDATNSATNGKVAYVSSGSKKRESDAGPGVNLDSAVSGYLGGWE